MLATMVNNNQKSTVGHAFSIQLNSPPGKGLMTDTIIDNCRPRFLPPFLLLLL